MNFNLTPEQLLLQENIYKHCSKLDTGLSFNEKWKYIASTGIVGTCVDQEFGGLGLGPLDLLLALEAMAMGNNDNGLSFSIAAHTLSCVIPISKYGSNSQKTKYLPGLLNGDLLAANAMTESESGSDVFSVQCKAIKKGNAYLLNGIKTFVSNSADSSLVLTYAETNPEKGFFGGLSAFIVDEGDYEKGARFKKMGLDSCSLGEIIFSEVTLDESQMLGKEGAGAFIFNHSMEWERICLTGIHLGAMERVLTRTIDFCRQRKSQGKSISSYQAISHTIADMQVLLDVSRWYAYRTAWLLGQNTNVSKEAAMVKLFVSNSVKSFMLSALQIFGGYGYIADYGIEREVRDVLASTIYSGTSEIQKNIIASNLSL